MNLVRLGRVARALRHRTGRRQRDVASQAELTQQAISLLERGHGGRLAIATIARVFAVFEADLEVVVRWRGGEIDRLLDEAHARLVTAVVELLLDAGWTVRVEVSYSRYGERGSIDVVGFHPDRAALLVVEVKSDVTSNEATLRKHDEKERLAPVVVRERFGWEVRLVGRLLVLPDTSAARRRIATAPMLGAAYPARLRELRRWLGDPSGTLAAVVFLPDTNAGGGRRRIGAAKRVRGTFGEPR